MDKLFDFTDQVAVITGGSRGLGRQMAYHTRLPFRTAAQMQELGDEAHVIFAGAMPRREATMRTVQIPGLRGLVS